MAGDEEYELLPKEEIDNLKKEVERLRKNPLGEVEEGESILDSINNLNNNIKNLIDIFSKASADLKNDEGEVSPLNDLKEIKEQNEDLAQGLVAVADMVKNIKQGNEQEQKVNLVPEENTPLSSGPRIAMVRPHFDDPALPPAMPPAGPMPGAQLGADQIPPPPPSLDLPPELPPLDPPPAEKKSGLFKK